MPIFADVRVRKALKRAFEVAAAGGPNNIIMIGPPGAGKIDAGKTGTYHFRCRCVRRLRAPKNTFGGRLIGRGNVADDATPVPFLTPPTISDVALIGGGADPKPAEFRWRTVECFVSR